MAKDGDGGHEDDDEKDERDGENDDDNGDGDADANQICHLYLMSAVMKSLFACEQNAENAN